MWGLCCCTWAFSSCGEWGLLFVCGVWSSHCGGFSCCRAQALGTRASVVVAHGLSSAGSIVVAHRLSCSEACGIFPDMWDWTRVPCIGRQILIYCIREAPNNMLLMKNNYVFLPPQKSLVKRMVYSFCWSIWREFNLTQIWEETEIY